MNIQSEGESKSVLFQDKFYCYSKQIIWELGDRERRGKSSSAV